MFISNQLNKYFFNSEIYRNFVAKDSSYGLINNCNKHC